MLHQHIAFSFFENLVKAAERKSFEISQLLVRPSKTCPLKFTFNLVKNLELAPELLLIALLIAKKAVDNNLKIQRKNLYRLITVCLILAEKNYEEESTVLQVYSLFTGITIKDLRQLQIKIMMHLDYHLLVSQEDFNLLLKGELE